MEEHDLKISIPSSQCPTSEHKISEKRLLTRADSARSFVQSFRPLPQQPLIAISTTTRASQTPEWAPFEIFQLSICSRSHAASSAAACGGRFGAGATPSLRPGAAARGRAWVWRLIAGFGLLGGRVCWSLQGSLRLDMGPRSENVGMPNSVAAHIAPEDARSARSRGLTACGHQWTPSREESKTGKLSRDIRQWTIQAKC